jgi:hypothetical protein
MRRATRGAGARARAASWSSSARARARAAARHRAHLDWLRSTRHDKERRRQVHDLVASAPRLRPRRRDQRGRARILGRGDPVCSACAI